MSAVRVYRTVGSTENVLKIKGLTALRFCSNTMNCLRLALLGCIASTALMHPFDLREQNSTCQKTEVVVLGAGVAGITAAVCLETVLSTHDRAKYL